MKSNRQSIIQKLEGLHIDLVTTCHTGCIKRSQSTESAMKKPGKHFRHKRWCVHPCNKSKSFHYGWFMVGDFEKDKCYFRVDWKVWIHKDQGAFDKKQNEQCWGLRFITGFLYLQLKLLWNSNNETLLTLKDEQKSWISIFISSFWCFESFKKDLSII